MAARDSANYSATESLRNGRALTVRAIRPGDTGLMADAFRRVSAESLYLRTFSARKNVNDKELAQLADVDFDNVVALVAVMQEEGQESIIGGGRYIRSGAGAMPSAEVAFLVDDDHQGLGIGSRVFKHLIAIARSSGIKQFEAEVLPSNDGMLRLFDNSGLKVTKQRVEDVVHVTIALIETGNPAE